MDRLTEWLGRFTDFGWAVDITIVITVTLLARFVVFRGIALLRRSLGRLETRWLEALLEAAHAPLNWFIMLVGLLWAVQISAGWFDTQLFSPAVLAGVRRLAFIALAMAFLLRFISLSELRLRESIDTTTTPDEARMDAGTLHALARLLRLSVVIGAALIALPAAGIEITALLAFGGIGGVVIGLAAQDLLANFFGGLMIHLDRPFAVGDWIRSPDREIEGTVERIGWRLTLVRTFDKRPLYVPNSLFTKLALENPSRMTNRRIYETIGIRYEDAALMGVIVADVKAMLRSHEEIDGTQTLIVNFNSWSPSSLDFFVYTFTKTTDWIRFHEIKQDVMLKIIDIVHSHGADFAFPTTTLEGRLALQPTPEPG